jgi:AmmeMemoRadiSam system protein B
MRTLPVVLIALFLVSNLLAQEVRSIRDDVGFCWNAEQMKRLIAYLEANEKEPASTFIAGISPHDDYLYAARIYFPLFRSIKCREVVIFGVTHGTVRKEIGDPQGILILDEHKSWIGCGKDVAISPLRGFIKSNLDTQYYRVNNKAHELEHSIEAMVPWLQYFNPEVSITPIMITAMPFERIDEVSEKLAVVISDYIKKNQLTLGKDIFFLCSSDANHYGKDFNNIPFGEDDAAHLKGIEQDQRIGKTFLSGRVVPDTIRNFLTVMKNVVWCGKFSIPFGMLTADKIVQKTLGRHLTGVILRYSDSYTEGVIPLKKTGMGITAPFSLKHWVGYLSAGYWVER